MMKNTHVAPLSRSSGTLGVGGQIKPTLMGRMKGMFSNMSTTTMVLFVIAIIIFIIIGYFTYKELTTSKAAFHANREHIPQETGKEAELVLFYVDWCPHCKTAKPEWEKLKSEYEGKTINGYTMIFTEHNCTNETAEVEQLMNKYKIEGYPTIKLIKDNQVIEYDAKPTKSTMEQFLNTVL